MTASTAQRSTPTCMSSMCASALLQPAHKDKLPWIEGNLQLKAHLAARTSCMRTNALYHVDKCFYINELQLIPAANSPPCPCWGLARARTCSIRLPEGCRGALSCTAASRTVQSSKLPATSKLLVLRGAERAAQRRHTASAVMRSAVQLPTVPPTSALFGPGAGTGTAAVMRMLFMRARQW